MKAFLPCSKTLVILVLPLFFFGCGAVELTEDLNGILVDEESSSLTTSSISLTAASTTTVDRVCWGDLHGHSTMSDGKINPYAYFQRARDEAQLDFVAITDHIWLHKPFMDESKWRQDLLATVHYHAPGSFVTFNGFEWTTSGGHFTAYFPGNNPPVQVVPNTLDELSEIVEQAGGLLHVAHPVVRPGVFDPVKWELSSLTNITNAEVSGYQGILFEEGYQALLAQGLKLGAIAVSDIHTGPPGKNGLTAVWVDECNREEILNALRDRRNYASTGERVELVFKADGHWMGEEYAPEGDPLLTVEAQASTMIESVTILKDGAAVLVRSPESSVASITYQDVDYSNESPHYYQVNIVMENGHRLWSSPIWTN